MLGWAKLRGREAGNPGGTHGGTWPRTALDSQLTHSSSVRRQSLLAQRVTDDLKGGPRPDSTAAHLSPSGAAGPPGVPLAAAPRLGGEPRLGEPRLEPRPPSSTGSAADEAVAHYRQLAASSGKQRKQGAVSKAVSQPRCLVPTYQQPPSPCLCSFADASAAEQAMRQLIHMQQLHQQHLQLLQQQQHQQQQDDSDSGSCSGSGADSRTPRDRERSRSRSRERDVGREREDRDDKDKDGSGESAHSFGPR